MSEPTAIQPVSTPAPPPPPPPPPPPVKAKKPWYLRWWAIVIAVFLGIGTVSSIVSPPEDGKADTASSSETTAAPESTDPPATEAPTTEAPTTVPPTTAPPTTAAPTTAPPPAEPPQTAQARRKAQDYIDYSGFSRSGLIDQLEFEGFPTDAATVAVDSLSIDWYEQAVRKAQDYIEYSAFSHSGLVDQLEFEGFSPDEAEHGATVALG